MCNDTNTVNLKLFEAALNTSPKPHLQKVLPCRHPCHTRGLGHGTLCEVASPDFHALNGRDCTDGPQLTWDLGPHVNWP